jgi:hypothetical protein
MPRSFVVLDPVVSRIPFLALQSAASEAIG